MDAAVKSVETVTKRCSGDDGSGGKGFSNTFHVAMDRNAKDCK